MARRINVPKDAPAKGASHTPGNTPSVDGGHDDLEIMYPDVTLSIAGREITVREYRFLDGLRARAKGKALIDALEPMISSGAAVEAGVEDYVDMLAVHHDVVVDLMADSVSGADRDWIDSLDMEDGLVLMHAWWGVCGRFFIRVVAARLRDRLMAKARRASAGQTSSTSSVEPDTVAPTNSATGTPGAN